jgi:hypothetical protein
MENINIHTTESICNSDTESADGENDLLYEFIFGPSKVKNAGEDTENEERQYYLSKADRKHTKSTFKNGRLNGKIKRSLNGLKKDSESPYRKVVVTTDLKSDTKPSKITFRAFMKSLPLLNRKWETRSKSHR